MDWRVAVSHRTVREGCFEGRHVWSSGGERGVTWQRQRTVRRLGRLEKTEKGEKLAVRSG